MKPSTLFATALLPILLAGFGHAAVPEPDASNRIVKNGIRVDFRIESVEKRKALMAGDLAEVRFSITEESTGKPLRGADPGAWMDMSQVIRAQTGAQQKSCKDKVSLYMQGAVGIRPMADLNGYHVLVMNAEPSLSVVDPTVSMAGRTSTLASVQLSAPGADWARSADQKRLYVSTPASGKLAVVDLETFKLVKNIEVGKQPTRTALQPDGRYLWVANDGSDKDSAGVSVIDTAAERVVAEIATGRGHHEIAFSADSRLAFVSNRSDGTVSVIDTAKLSRVTDLKPGPLPIAIAYSPLAKALYVADGEAGTVSVYDDQTLERRATINLKPGLGPLRFTPDGRHALVVNPAQDALYVIDAAANELAHTIAIKGEPYAVAMSQAFAYVRALKSERVSMIALRSLEKGGTPTVQSFAAGAQAPAEAGRLAIADAISAANSEASVFVVNPADNTTYFYMEGMNAPSSNYQVMGGSARAVTVVRPWPEGGRTRRLCGQGKGARRRPLRRRLHDADAPVAALLQRPGRAESAAIHAQAAAARAVRRQAAQRRRR